jgi:hypothetical protein
VETGLAKEGITALNVGLWEDVVLAPLLIRLDSFRSISGFLFLQLLEAN